MGLTNNTLVNQTLDYLGETEPPMDFAVTDVDVVIINHAGQKFRVPLTDLDIDAEQIEEASQLSGDEQPEDADASPESEHPVEGNVPPDAAINPNPELELAFEHLLDDAGVNDDQIATLRDAFGSLHNMAQVDLTKSALTALPGIGDATAEKILDATTESVA